MAKYTLHKALNLNIVFKLCVCVCVCIYIYIKHIYIHIAKLLQGKAGNSKVTADILAHGWPVEYTF